MSFRLVPKLVTLNALNDVVAAILRYFSEIGSIRAYCVKVKGKGFPILDTKRWARS